jgi:biopolymer transport protein ExbD
MLKRKKRIEADEFLTSPNVTPLVDVSLTLVIIFMVTAPMVMQAGIKILKSKAEAAKGKVSSVENVRVVLNNKNEIFLNGKKIERDEFPVRLRSSIVRSKDNLVMLSADDENRVWQVVEILDLARQNGAKKLAILGKNKKTKKR